MTQQPTVDRAEAGPVPRRTVTEPDTCQAGISYRLLGPLTVLRDDGRGLARTVLVGSPKQRAVLALLLLNRGRVVSIDRLIDALWAGDPPSSAVGSIQVYVSNLRRALRQGQEGDDPIARLPGGYVIRTPAVSVDACTFRTTVARAREALEAERWPDAGELAESALAMWRGAPLEDLRHQPWVQAEVVALEELATECRETRVVAWLAEGRLAPALQAARELHAAHAGRDRGCLLTMICLHRADRSADALAVYRDHVRDLDERLGLEPAASLRELELAILRHDPVLVTWPVASSRLATGAADRPVAPSSAQPIEVPSASPVIGREREQRVLRDAIAEASAGRARSVVLSGPAGIGKTRLGLTVIAEVRRAGGTAVRAGCSEDEAAPAWEPIRQLLQALGEDPDDALSVPAGKDFRDGRFSCFERVAVLLHSIAADHGPLALVVDDLQWIDRASASCLAHLVTTSPEARIILGLTLRDDDVASGAAALISALARAGGARQLTIGPLNAQDVTSLASMVSGECLSDAEGETLAALTGGNPSFVTECVLRSAVDRPRSEVPGVIQAAVDRRLGALRVEVRDALRAAAALGNELEMESLMQVAGLGPERLVGLLDEAAREQVIVPHRGGIGYAFAHDLLRAGILDATGDRTVSHASDLPLGAAG